MSFQKKLLSLVKSQYTIDSQVMPINDSSHYLKQGTVLTRENSGQVFQEERRQLLRPVKQFTRQIRDDETLKRVEDCIFKKKKDDAKRDLRNLIVNSQIIIDQAYQTVDSNMQKKLSQATAQESSKKDDGKDNSYRLLQLLHSEEEELLDLSEMLVYT